MYENIYLDLAYSLRGLFHYYHGGKHGSVQADMELEKKLRVPYLYPQTSRSLLPILGKS